MSVLVGRGTESVPCETELYTKRSFISRIDGKVAFRSELVQELAQLTHFAPRDRRDRSTLRVECRTAIVPRSAWNAALPLCGDAAALAECSHRRRAAVLAFDAERRTSE